MIGYAEKEVFTDQEKALWVRAVRLVEFAPYFDGTNEPIRCHELARAVGAVLNLEHEDGRFGFVEHTWLWTTPREPRLTPWVLPNVLDVYTPGSMPQVQLVHMANGLPHRYSLQCVSALDVRHDIVGRLVRVFQEDMKSW